MNSFDQIKKLQQLADNYIREMVKAASFDRHGMKKGAWSEDEDNKLRDFVVTYGHWNWRLLPKYAGLKRCGKSCRLRWVNHLKPGVKRGNFSKEEEDLIIKLHAKIGNKWSAIAMELPGRTDNDIKNFWHTRLAPRQRQRPRPTPAAAAASDDQLKAASSSSSSMEEMGQYSSLGPTSLIKTYHHRYSAIQTQPQNDDASSNLDKFCYPQLHHSSQNMISALDWIIPEEDRPSFFWDESYAFMNTSDFNPLEEEQGGIYDPLFCLWDS